MGPTQAWQQLDRAECVAPGSLQGPEVKGHLWTVPSPPPHTEVRAA